LLVIGAEAVSFQHSGQRAPQYLTSQNGTNPETTAHADEYEEGYVPEDATSEEHWKEDEWVGDEEHKEWDEHDLENKHFDPEKVCTLGDPNQCTSWGDDCCGSMEWDEPQTCAEGYYPVDMGNSSIGASLMSAANGYLRRNPINLSWTTKCHFMRPSS
jgi:hypothetical protein